MTKNAATSAKAIEWFDAHSRRITAVFSAMSAVGMVVVGYLAAQPQPAELPKEQLDAISKAIERSERAIVLAQLNQSQLESRKQDFIPCVLRTMDRLLDETGVKPTCPLVMPN